MDVFLWARYPGTAAAEAIETVERFQQAPPRPSAEYESAVLTECNVNALFVPCRTPSPARADDVESSQSVDYVDFVGPGCRGEM